MKLYSLLILNKIQKHKTNYVKALKKTDLVLFSRRTVSPHINLHALIFEDALSFRKEVHARIFKHKNNFFKFVINVII